jgi:hypothetical protein
MESFFPLRLSLRREATAKALTAPWNAGHCEQLQESPAAVTPQDMIQQIYSMYDVSAFTVCCKYYYSICLYITTFQISEVRQTLSLLQKETHIFS